MGVGDVVLGFVVGVRVASGDERLWFGGAGVLSKSSYIGFLD